MATRPRLTGDVVYPVMSDGCLLTADLYRPPSTGRFPTLVRKTPYSRERPPLLREVDYFVEHGYAVLIASMRGRHGSQGEFRELRNEGWLEHSDGYDTIEWAAAEEWSNGEIGTFGISSDAQWQLATAPTQPPHLKAMFVSYASHPRGAVIDRGILTSTGPGWYSMEGAFGRRLSNTQDWSEWLSDWRENHLPLIASFIHPELVEFFVNNESGGYWDDTDPATRYGDFAVPVFHECGWYDRYPRWHVEHFQGVRSSVDDPSVKQSQRLILGPWTHGGAVAPDTEEVRFGKSAHIDRLELQRQWFDFWLKHENNGMDEAPAVRVFLMGADEWIDGNDWPLEGASFTRYYLRSGEGSPRESLNGGLLSPESPGDELPDVYDHDPYDPVPTIGGHGGTGWVWPPGPLDQRPAESRSLTFTTETLKEDLDVIGEVRISLTVSATTEDADFIVTLTDVFPSGYSAILRQNGARAVYRNTEEQATPLTPGEAVRLEFALAPVANRFRAGHRLRISVASSSFPAYIPNVGQAHDVHLARDALPSRISIYHEHGKESFIEVPVAHGLKERTKDENPQ